MSGFRRGWPALLLAIALSAGLAACQKSDSGGKKKRKSKPELYLVLPSAGPITGGSTVTLFTRNFNDNFLVNVPEVYFGGLPSPNVTPATPVEVYAEVPSGGAIGDVDVVLTSTGDVQSATCKGCFGYTQPPTCSVTGIARKDPPPAGPGPAEGDISGGDTAIIFGNGFGDAGDPQTEVFFGTEQSPFVLRISPQELEATVPAAAGGTPGFVNVDVVTAAGANCTFPGGWNYTVVQCAITAISPSSGLVTGGETVTITGSNFDPLAQVLFGVDPATNVVVSPAGDSITCDTPPASVAGPVTIEVNNVTHVCLLVDGYTYLPVGGCDVTSVFPQGGSVFGGNTVTITGDMFEAGPPIPQVEFGGALGSNVNVIDAQTIEVQVPGTVNPGLVDVLVRNQTSGLTCTLQNGYEYISPGTCGVFSVDPPVGSTFGGDMVTLHGAGFQDPPDEILFGSNPVNLQMTGHYNWIDEFTVEVITPPSVGTGTVDVTYVNPGPDPCVLAGGFTYEIPITGCSISAITPNQGPRTGGTWVTIDGTDFNEEVNGGARVFFGKGSGLTQANPWFTVVIGTTQITSVTPGILNPKTVDVVVIGESSGSSCTLVDGFTYLSGCTIVDISPPSGSMTGGEVVTISGSLFDPGGDVRFGDNFSPSVTVISPNQIQAVTPPSQVSGPVTVRVLGSQAIQCSMVDGFTYQAGGGGGGCTVTSVVPSTGNPRGGDVVTITGSGFDAGPPVPGVLFGLNPATNVQVVSPTTITCISPNALYSGEVDITVVNANGDTCSLPAAFLYDTLPTCEETCALTDIMPIAGPLTGGNQIAVNGTGFCAGVKAYVGNKQASVSMFSPTQVFIQVPPGDQRGFEHVWLLNPSGQACLLPDAYEYQ